MNTICIPLVQSTSTVLKCCIELKHIKKMETKIIHYIQINQNVGIKYKLLLSTINYKIDEKVCEKYVVKLI